MLIRSGLTAAAALVGAALSLPVASGTAEAGTQFSIGFGVGAPAYALPYYAPPPVYYAPAPVYVPPAYAYAPPTIVVQPPPPPAPYYPPFAAYYAPRPIYARPAYFW